MKKKRRRRRNKRRRGEIKEINVKLFQKRKKLNCLQTFEKQCHRNTHSNNNGVYNECDCSKNGK